MVQKYNNKISRPDEKDGNKVQPEAVRILTDPDSWRTGTGSGSGHNNAPDPHSTDGLCLTDGNRVAVVGGGPAGTLFSRFLMRTLRRIGTHIELDIFEPRNFNYCGPAGCNHCGGVVSESLVQLLAADGIILPDETVQRGIDSYVMHMDVGSVRIDTPLQEKRIAAVYRGHGPKKSEQSHITGFDHYLLREAVRAGAHHRPHMVTSVDFDSGHPQIKLADGRKESYDLVVVASGLNSALLGLVEQTGRGFSRPQMAKSFVAEFKLGAAAVERHLGSSMNVFLLDLPHLQFAALIPKGDYVTLVMLGDKVDEGLVNAFLNAEEVRRCFPDNRPPQNICQCLPRLNVTHARKPYADRVVFIGDSGVARLYKDGIGSAYRTAKAAANCVALYGYSERNFKEHYWPACRKIVFDNMIGKCVFGVCHLIQRLTFARRGVLRMTEQEQYGAGVAPRMSSVLWDVFTGSAPYREVLLRTLHPVFISRLLWNLAAANLRLPSARKRGVTAS
ncbi:NAD(P)/FAD-dependent oxidoreductase [Seongchinamella unica]|uniref:NAD(P)/FAD-dependent oxidoreductase n=1 Tax=Seongchinamella unica TaxID=2547392 RepID=UPI0014045F25|nr:hypothetical protein [Seongchinamella unica]